MRRWGGLPRAWASRKKVQRSQVYSGKSCEAVKSESDSSEWRGRAREASAPPPELVLTLQRNGQAVPAL